MKLLLEFESHLFVHFAVHASGKSHFGDSKEFMEQSQIFTHGGEASLNSFDRTQAAFAQGVECQVKRMSGEGQVTHWCEMIFITLQLAPCCIQIFW